jgi:nephrocystin-4
METRGGVPVLDHTDNEYSRRWLSFYRSEQRFLPIPENDSSDHTPAQGPDTVPLRLVVEQVTSIPLGVLPELPKLPKGSEVNLRFRCTLSFFHKTGRYFFGRTWRSGVSRNARKGKIGNDAGTVTVEFGDTVFYHTHIRDKRCVGIFEVLAAASPVNSPVETAPVEFSVGWGLVPAFAHEPRDDWITKGNIPIYNGSPRALFFESAADLEARLVQRAPSCRLDYELAVHPGLDPLLHLLRENELIDDTMAVPGVTRDFFFDGPEADPTREEDLKEEDASLLLLPHPLSSLCLAYDPEPCLAEELELGEFVLRGATTELEDKMVAALEADRLREFGVQDDKRAGVRILKRSVVVTLHNGHTPTTPPLSVELRASPDDSEAFENMTVLTVPDFVPHVGVAVILSVLYTVKYGGKGGSGERVVSIGWVPFIPVELGAGDELNRHLEGAFSYSLLDGFGKSVDGSAFNFAPETLASKDLSFEFSVYGQQHRPYKERNINHEQDMEYSDEPSVEEEHIESQEEPEEMAMAFATKADEEHFEVMAAAKQQPEEADVAAWDEKDRGAPGVHEQEMLAPISMVHGPEPAYPAAHVAPLAQYDGPTDGRISRARLAELFQQGYPELSDTNGRRPVDLTFDVRNPGGRPDIDAIMRAEASDPTFRGNEVVLQFLAYEATPDEPMPKHVFFTTQFFRFPMVATEGLHVSHDAPHALSRVDAASQQPSPHKGFVVKFPVANPSDVREFAAFLGTKTLSIDVWDGNSMLPVGTATLDLHGLLRKHKSAVQWVDALPVMPQPDSVSTARERSDIPLPLQTRGNLYVRVANIGRPLDGPDSLIQVTEHLVQESAKPVNSQDTAVVPRRLPEVDVELAEALAARRTGPYTAEEAQQMLYDADGMFVADATRRKRGRFAMVQHERAVAEKGGEADNRARAAGTTYAEQREMERDFKLIDTYRERRKRDMLTNHLREALCSRHTLRPSFGETEFFEFRFTNPYAEEHYFTVVIDDDSALQVIEDASEIRQFKRTLGLTTPTEENLLQVKTAGGPAGVFLRANETVHIPFKYISVIQRRSQAAKANTEQPLGSDGMYTAAMDGESHDTFLSEFSNDDIGDPRSSNRTLHVSVQNHERRAVAVVDVFVRPRPPIIDQTFHFYHAENDFLKRSIRVPPRVLVPSNSTDSPQCYVRCSDMSVLVGTAGGVQAPDQALRRSDGSAVFIKVRCGPSPTVSRFYLIVYADAHGTQVAAVWQVFVHALQRLDLHAMVGQAARTSLLMRGSEVPRLVQAFSSSSALLRVPQVPFSLVGGSLNEISATFLPLVAGPKQLLVNVVDVEYHSVVAAWVLHTESSPPHVTKAYELPLITGQLKKKKLTYANPYAQRKNLIVRTDKPHLLHVTTPNVEIGPGESVQVGLTFSPSNSIGRVPIMVFINDADHDKTEEAIVFTCTYQER